MAQYRYYEDYEFVYKLQENPLIQEKFDPEDLMEEVRRYRSENEEKNTLLTHEDFLLRVSYIITYLSFQFEGVFYGDEDVKKD